MELKELLHIQLVVSTAFSSLVEFTVVMMEFVKQVVAFTAQLIKAMAMEY